MLHRVAIVRPGVTVEFRASFIRVTRIGEIGTTLAVTSNRRTHTACVGCYSYRCSLFTDSCHPDEGGARFLRNGGSYKSHTA
jgi:hypothetical protein